MKSLKSTLRCALPGALFVLGLVFIAPAFAGEGNQDNPYGHKEAPDDPYIRSPRSDHARSPGKTSTKGSFFFTQVNVDELGQNIVGDAANEPSLAVDPNDPNKMTIGWRQFDTVASNFRQAGYAYTTDGGQTWTFPGVIEPGVFRSDPVLDTDSQGGVYYNSLTLEGGSDFVCDVYRTPVTGQPWDEGVDARGGDKQWMVIDKSGGSGDGHIYSFWTNFYSTCYPGFFTRSVDEGDYYEPCIQIPEEPRWGTLAISPENGFADPGGILYIVGSHDNNFVVARSTNARYAGQDTDWDLSTLVSLGGSISSFGGPNPEGLHGQASIATAKRAAGQGHNVYILCSVDPGTDDPLDVRFSRSQNRGSSWSPSVRVNDDVGNNWQWFGTMSASPLGRIDVIWLDTRDNPGTYLSSLYYSSSSDGGVTWSANERLSEAFDPHLGFPNQNKMGDYFHMVSDDAGFSLAWSATFNGEQDVYYGRMNLAASGVEDPQDVSLIMLTADPNPFTGSTTLRYDLPQDVFVTLAVYDMAGRKISTLVSSRQPAGTHLAHLDGSRLASGVYLCRLSAGMAQDTEKLLIVK